MIDSVNQQYSASASMNSILRGLSGVSGRGGANRRQPIEATKESSLVSGKSELTEEELQEVEKLKKRDSEVRRHEQAHKAAAGSNSKGGPSFEYETGPDGRQYATGGEVQIDTSEVANDPDATIRKMQQIQRAASAPAQPSSQDRSVAAAASQTEAKARTEKVTQNREDASNGDANSTGDASAAVGAAVASVATSKSGSFSKPHAAKSFQSAAYASQSKPSALASQAGRFIDVRV